ncbi:MAG: Serine/threonine protein kinase, partial [uncultured Solirubrobacteraceae bacterium]
MLHPGTRVGGYRVDGVLGAGGMGAVYRATQLSLKREVALKILAGELAQDESFRERFRREGEIQASIDHPNIVTIYEAGDIGDNLFIAMRLIRGPALKALILGRDLDPARTLRILQPIADALDTAHQFGLIHRDVKPQNILVDARDRAFLADFGLTKGAHDSGLTRTGQFVGTIDYISPEQIRGEPATPASDIYALAAVLFECLTGVVPFARPSDAAILFAHITDPPPRLSEQRPELPPALDEVLARGMAKFPSDRHATASELIDEAERAFGGKLRVAPAPPITKPDNAGIPPRQGDVATAGVGIPPAPTQAPHGAPGGLSPGVAPTAPANAPATAETQAPAPRGRSPESRETPPDRSPDALRLRPRRPPEGNPS